MFVYFRHGGTLQQKVLHLVFENAVQSSVHGNDFSTLIEELNAYAGAAELELELARSKLLADFKISGVKSYEGNISEMVDLMQFSLEYLKFVEKYPATISKLRTSPLLLAHLQRLWTQSESIICAVAPYTKDAGGILAISNDKLAAIYSDEFIPTLGRLDVKHMTAKQAKKCRPQT